MPIPYLIGTRSHRCPSGIRAWTLGLVIVITIGAFVPVGQAQEASDAAAETTAESSIADTYGLWVVVPALATIIIAIVLRQVIPALCLGILMAAYMLVPFQAPESAFAETPNWIAGLRIATEEYLISAIAETDHIKVVIFTLTIGGMVGMLAVNGGTAALVAAVSKWASNSRRAQFVTWIAGLVVFFDDYANTMMIGPTMQPVFDRLRTSRAKLAYIVDSTAAPVASLALIGTWIGAEVGYIQEGLNTFKDGNAPAFLTTVQAYPTFFYSLAYRFYPILALWMVMVVALSGRDFGPMKRAERHCATKESDCGRQDVESDRMSKPTSIWMALFPIIVLVGLTLGLLLYTGIAGMESVSGEGQATEGHNGFVQSVGPYLEQLLSNADAYGSILYGALGSVVAALIVSLIGATASLKALMNAWLDGLARMMPAIVVLVLAWALSKAMQDLQLGAVATTVLQEANFDARWLPTAVFIAAALVSFATGTSWGTMGILCPMTVIVAAQMGATLSDEGHALTIFYASVGAVLAGAVFGDHCSPISDTTILSSVASGCTVEEHVWTQLPYALVTALVAVLFGHIMCSYFDLAPWVGMLVGAVVITLMVLVLGRTTDTPIPSVVESSSREAPASNW